MQASQARAEETDIIDSVWCGVFPISSGGCLVIVKISCVHLKLLRGLWRFCKSPECVSSSGKPCDVCTFQTSALSPQTLETQGNPGHPDS